MVNIELVISIIALIVSIFSVIFIALPYRDSLKPKLRIEIKGRYKEKEIQKVLEWDDLNLYITNISNNTAKDIKVRLISEIMVKSTNEKRTLEDEEKIIYLHPNEATSFPLKSILSIHTKNDDLFETKTKGTYWEQKFPKKSLVINLKIEVFAKGYKTYDDFFIEWDSLEQSPDWKAPRIKCYNKRRDKYIMKIEIK